MKLNGLILAFLYSSLAFGGVFDRIDSHSGDYCKDQVKHYLTEVMEGNISILKIKSASGGHNGGSYKEYWVKTDACDGQLVFQTVNLPSCKVPHYGFVPVYVRRLWATPGCREFLGKDRYPRKSDFTGLY